MNRDDIARIAGVSSATVSRAFNKPERVAPEKRELIFKVAAENNYFLDKNASSLRRKGTGVITLVASASDSSHISRIYLWTYADVLKGVANVVNNTSYRLQIEFINTSDDLKRIVEYKNCDALIGVNLYCENALKILHNSGVPYIYGSPQYKDPNGKYSTTSTDSFYGGYIAARKFYETGHKKPFHVTGNLGHDIICIARWEGFRDSFAESGIDVALLETGVGIDAGSRSAEELYERIKAGKCDSVFVVNDLTATGLINNLLSKGIKIPKDVSIIGYDNLPFIDTLAIKLTTIDLSLREAMEAGVIKLLSSMDKFELIHNLTKPCLVEGESVAYRNE